MRVSVHYLSQIRRAVGCASEPIDAPDGTSLTDLLVRLAERHGDALRSLLLDETSCPRRSLLFFVGDEHADPRRTLRDGDAVTILAPMAGG